MSFLNTINLVPTVKPAFNVGCLLDIPTGTPVKGIKGETIINGGVRQLTGQTGEANSAKTGMALFYCLRVVERYNPAALTIYDTETTLTQQRVRKVAMRVAPSTINEEDDNLLHRVAITSAEEYTGDEIFEKFKKYGQERPKLKADYHETPFLDGNTKQPVKILTPELMFIDSFSKFGTDATEEIQDKADIGDSKQNTLFLKDGLVKTQMMMQLPNISGKNGLYFIMTAQIGEIKNLEPNKAPRQTLSFLKGNLKLKKVPDEFRYNVHDLWYNFKMRPLTNQNTKGPEYPRDSADNQNAGDTDLVEIVTTNLRGKSGKSGKMITILYSQSDGVLDSLSEFNFIKTEKFGLGGNNQDYFVELYPDVKLSRTKVRGKLEEDPLLRKAVKLTSDLLQIQQEWTDIPDYYMITPKELREKIIKLGYDWNELLATRDYWTFDQYTNPVPFLSIIDLLDMSEGLYTPYWKK